MTIGLTADFLSGGGEMGARMRAFDWSATTLGPPEDWPVEQITIGGRTYTKSQAITLMGTAGAGDKTYDMFKQLVAAKLNVLVGNEASCINSTIASADSWMASHPVGSGVSSGSSAWSTGGPLHETLDSYNNGELCAPHRD